MASDAVAEHKATLRKLMLQKSELEKEITDLQESLSAIPNPDRLVDAEGFPRSDIDVHSVTLIKQQLHLRQNDHKALMKTIERSMFAMHSGLKSMPAQAAPVAVAQPPKPVPDVRVDEGKQGVIAINQDPFFKINLVHEGSPGHAAGLQVGDHVLQFGTITAKNVTPEAMQRLVQSSVNQPIEVVVRRDDATQRLTLVPAQWSGNGLLGVSFVNV